MHQGVRKEEETGATSLGGEKRMLGKNYKEQKKRTSVTGYDCQVGKS